MPALRSKGVPVPNTPPAKSEPALATAGGDASEVEPDTDIGTGIPACPARCILRAGVPSVRARRERFAPNVCVLINLTSAMLYIVVLSCMNYGPETLQGRSGVAATNTALTGFLSTSLI
jgi:hypothetical protein